MARGRFLPLMLAGLAMLATPHDVFAQDDPPGRVVSMNLCTDQLAMLLAAPGQILSVSHLAADPRSSAMADEAKQFILNRGLAEEIYLLEPDLVIAGSFSQRVTIDMLRRLDVPVEVMEPAYSLTDIRDRIARMGALLHRGAEAERILADFDGRLAEIVVDRDIRPRAAIYHANGYTSGERSLAGEILAAAGFENIAREAGVPAGGHVALEVLAMTNPDALITGQRYPGAARSEEILDHPVVHALRDRRIGTGVTDRDWVCGTPFVLRAIETLAAERPR